MQFLNKIATLPILAILVFGSNVAMAQQYALVETSAQPLSNKICATCHGAEGKGNPVVGGPKLAGLEPWYLKQQLQSFRAGYRGMEESYIPGQEMQASVARLSDGEIETLTAYIAEWKPMASMDTISGDSRRGSELYSSCAACHGTNAGGNVALNAPGLADKDDWYLLRQLKLFKSGYRGSHPGDQHGSQMRAAVSVLETDQDMTDVLAYINTL